MQFLRKYWLLIAAALVAAALFARHCAPGLIEDIQRAYYHQADEVFGTQLETYQYGEAAVEPSPSPPAVESRLQEDAGS